jgi:hypothetical protein
MALMAAGVHVRIIRAMDRHQDDAKVLLKACGTLMNLALICALISAQSLSHVGDSEHSCPTKTTELLSIARSARGTPSQQQQQQPSHLRSRSSSLRTCGAGAAAFAAAAFAAPWQHRSSSEWQQREAISINSKRDCLANPTRLPVH